MTHDTAGNNYPPFSITECSTYPATLDEDLAAYRAAGVDGIGLWEFKLPADDVRSLAALRASGLRATLCVPRVPSIYPDAFFTSPLDPKERTAALIASIRRFAKFDPVGILVVTGDPADHDRKAMRRATVDGLRAAAEAAEDAGVVLGIEGYRAGSLVTAIPDLVDLVDEVDRPSLKVIADAWHIWDTQDVVLHLERYAGRLLGFQVCDYRNPSRSWADRVLPGDGVIDLVAMLRGLRAGGYEGWYDLEIFSDDGRFGTALPDSLWLLEPEDLARTALARFRRLWDDSRVDE